MKLKASWSLEGCLSVQQFVGYTLSNKSGQADLGMTVVSLKVSRRKIVLNHPGMKRTRFVDAHEVRVSTGEVRCCPLVARQDQTVLK